MDGDYHFYIDGCPSPLSSPSPGHSFGCGMNKVLKMWITGMESSPIVDWDQLTNLPNSITGNLQTPAQTETHKLTKTPFYTQTQNQTKPVVLVS